MNHMCSLLLRRRHPLLQLSSMGYRGLGHARYCRPKVVNGQYMCRVGSLLKNSETPYFVGLNKYKEDAYDEIENPNGVIQLGLAEYKCIFATASFFSIQPPRPWRIRLRLQSSLAVVRRRSQQQPARGLRERRFDDDDDD
ncbi:hypothetical protein ACFE04_019224 [Oxalis oulophora]